MRITHHTCSATATIARPLIYQRILIVCAALLMTIGSVATAAIKQERIELETRQLIPQKKRLLIENILDLMRMNNGAATNFSEVLGEEHKEEIDAEIDELYQGFVTAFDSEFTLSELKILQRNLSRGDVQHAFDILLSVEEQFIEPTLDELSQSLQNLKGLVEFVDDSSSDSETLAAAFSEYGFQQTRAIEQHAALQQISEEEYQALLNEHCQESKPGGTAIYRPNPLYPFVAEMLNIEGVVELNYSIDAQGSTKDITISYSDPGAVFAYPAVKALENYVFCPNQPEENRELRIVFEMEG